jgi:hypothetical protein
MGKCLECVANTDCKVATKPICNTATNTCAPCQSDAECPTDPGVCLDDGHCAAKAEVIFVEGLPAGCAGADGSSAKPYCAPNDAVAAMTDARHVVVIRGAVTSPMAIASGVLLPVVVGQKNTTGDPGTISAGVGVAVRISSDDVLVRDLIVNGGSIAGAKGVVVSGTKTKTSLRRVTVALGTGLGVAAEAGAALTMDRCIVQNNSAGGVTITGASYDIQNSVIAGNGFGAKFTSTAISAGSQFKFNTVLAGAGVATTCDPANLQNLTDSVVVGINDCTLTNSVTAMPTFSTAKPFHLTAHLACPAAPATFPAYDIDGDPRVAPTIDCGADQYVP